jgi:hypothetical protein
MRAFECWASPSADAYRPLKPAFIQVGPPFVERLRTLLGALGASTAPVHFGEDWKFTAPAQSQVAARSISSLPRHVQQAHSLRRRHSMRACYPAAPAKTSLPMTVLHHYGQQRNEQTPSHVVLRSGTDPSGSSASHAQSAPRPDPVRRARLWPSRRRTTPTQSWD